MQHKGEIVLKASNFQLLNKPRITKNIFEANKEFDFSGEISLEIDNSINIVKILEEDMQSMVILNLKFFKDINFNEVPFKLEMEIEGIFTWDEDLNERESQLEILLKENAPAILYSYLRPIISLMTVEANMPPLVIPLMNFRK